MKPISKPTLPDKIHSSQQLPLFPQLHTQPLPSIEEQKLSPAQNKTGDHFTNQTSPSLFSEFPKGGISKESIHRELRNRTKSDVQIDQAQTFSLIYNGGEEIQDVIGEILREWHMYNMLGEFGPMASLKELETEAITWAGRLFHSPTQHVYGDITSGGTESNLLAVLTARNWARKNRPYIKTPEIILSETAHPSFAKAAELFGMKIKYIPPRKDFRVDVDALVNAISPETVLIVGSAPCYPFGVVDPIEDLANLAKKHGILCHVDACLGGFHLPFVEKLGYQTPVFDFRLPGVTSISSDLHKFGYGPRGSSFVIYRDKDLWRKQFFISQNWSGYIYLTRTLQGSRPGGIVMAAWAAMKFLGEEGYLTFTEKTMQTADDLQKRINQIEGLKVLSNPEGGIFAFTTTDDALDVYSISEVMKEKYGWWIDPQQNPPSIHMTLSPVHFEIKEKFLRDLEETISFIKKNGKRKNGEAGLNRFLASYPDREMVKNLIEDHLTNLNKPEKKEGADEALQNLLLHPVSQKLLQYKVCRYLLRKTFQILQYFESSSQT